MAQRKPGLGQTALMTGASAGIGVDLAKCFTCDSYNLILAARSEAALRDVATRLASAHGVQAHADLGAHGGGSAPAGEIAKRGLNVDIVVNNAGNGHAATFAALRSATP